MNLDSTSMLFWQQGKAHLPTLNVPFFHKVQLDEPRIHAHWPYFNAFPTARESPPAHLKHALVPQGPTCTNDGSMNIDPTSMLLG